MNQTQLNSPESECRQLLLSCTLAIAIITGLSFLIPLIISSFFPSTSISYLANFTKSAASGILPEPMERRVFQVMVLLTPIIVLLCHAIVKRLSPLLLSFSAFVKLGYPPLVVFMILWINSWAFCPDFMLSSGLGSFSLILPVITGVVTIIYVFVHIRPLEWMNILIKKRVTIALILVWATCFLIAVSFRVFDWKSLFENVNFDAIHHMNPVLYYTSMAETGRYTTSLGAPQYGIYSLYLKPLFNIIGLTVYSFSLIMTLLYLLAVIAITLPIIRHMQNPYLKLLIVPVLCALQGALGQASYIWIPFFQYYPIRFLLPALSILMLYLILNTKKENTRLCLTSSSSFTLGFLIFWNLDSGITTIIAWLGFFLLFAFIETIKRRALFNTASFLCVAAVAMLALGAGGATIILITCDQTGITISRLFEMQRIFYLNGFSLLPMPLSLHPWMAVLGIYLATLGVTLPIILRSGLQSSPKRILAFFVAILGIGLFTYYQGRSHDMNLPAVAWPAIICCFLACDWCLSADPEKRLSAIRLLSLPFMIIAVSLSVKLAWNCPWYFNRMLLLHKGITTTELNSKTMYMYYTIAWLSEYRNEPPGSVLIICPGESVYYVESGLHPLAPLPSEQERFFFNWQEAEMQKIIRTGNIRHLFISPVLSKTPEYHGICETIFSLYKPEEKFLLEHWTLKAQPTQ